MEPFPAVSSLSETSGPPVSQNAVRPRRKSSNLGGALRGDTGSGSLATADLQHHIDQPLSPPLTPRDGKSHDRQPRERKRKRARKLFNRWKRMSLKHTWINPLILVLVILAAYFISPGEQNPLHYAIFLAYANPPLHERTNTLPAHIGNVTQYGKGPLDFAFVGFYAIVLTFTREFLMQLVIRPLAIRCGIYGRNKQNRFMEQFYTAIYFSIFGPFGLWVMSRTPVWYFNTAGMYDGFPHRSHESYFKAYYLLQAAYWAQQGLVLLLQLEKPRKDFKELVLHHVITLALIDLSYRFHFTYMGIAVYITHDISDFFLATSKVLNYIDSMFTAPYFVFFVSTWVYLRHYLNLIIIVSLLPPAIGEFVRNIIPSTNFETGQFATVGPFELNWDTQQYKCLLSQSITLGLLATLQAVNIFWLFLIFRVLYRVLFRGVQKDERSDDEEDYEDEEPVKISAAPTPQKPQVMLNGEPVAELETDGRLTATGVQTRSASARKKR